MSEHHARRMSLREWVRHDMQRNKVPGAPTTRATLAATPRLWLGLVVDIVVVGAIYLAGLYLFGRIDRAIDWMVYPALVAGGILGNQILEVKRLMATPPPVSWAPGRWRVTLQTRSRRFGDLIHAVRTVAAVDLPTAKGIVAQVPSAVVSEVDEPSAIAIRNMLERAGGRATIASSD